MINLWPNPVQELLLKAILLNGESGYSAWEQWDASVDFNRLDYHTCCLMPCLYFALRDRSIKSPTLPSIKGIYRKYWCKNQLQFRQLRIVQQKFQEAGLPLIVIRGVALALRSYRDSGLRPVEQLDLLIQAEHIEPVQKLLQDQAWKSVANPYNPNSQYFVNSQGNIKLELHLDAWPLSLDAQAETLKQLHQQNSNLWQAAQSFSQPDGAVFQMLCPADQLLQVLIQGTYDVSHRSPYRW
ncbi:MAG: nucleotidyltransferase family protein, partial [Leptolyngbya sp. SIO4C1]|nr:nucleotidyltransferase family protein [Leptolyngbya sp. SIO4C1]